MRARRWTAAAILTGITMSGAACGTDVGSSLPPGTTQNAGFNALEQPDEVPPIARAYLGEDIAVRRITLSETGFSLEVRDPDKPENLDTYRYDGRGWTSTPVSVSLHDIEELPQTTFRLGAVNWKAVPTLVQRAYDGLDLEGEEITSISFDRIAGNPPRVYIGVNGLRGSGRLIANADGTHVEVARN